MNQHEPLGTFLIPVYNAEQYLAEMIETLLNQTRTDFLVLFIDDGSTDRSVEIIQAYEDDRFEVYKKEKNEGLEAALNDGLKQIKTKYVLRMDADDKIPDYRYELQIRFMEGNPDVDISSGYIQCFGNDSETWKVATDPDRIEANLIFTPGVTHAACIFRMNTVKRLSETFIYESRFPHMEDYYLWLKLLGKVKFGNLDKVLYYYRREGQNKTIKAIEHKENNLSMMYKYILENKFEATTNAEIIDSHLALSCYSVDKTRLKKVSVNQVFTHSMRLIKWNKECGLFKESALKEVIDAKLEKMFYRYADISFWSGLRFLFKLNFFNTRKWYYLVSKLRV